MKLNRILLKLSGEALLGKNQYGIDNAVLEQYATEIKSITDIGVKVGIVIGGGNIFRGLKAAGDGMNRSHADYMGMLATVINSMAIQSALEQVGVKSRLMSAFNIDHICELFVHNKAKDYLNDGYVVIISAGTGNPFFTTDTASALRAVEIQADALLKGTRVDGIYTADPEKDKNAVKYPDITFKEALDKQLHIMDLTAFTLCMENNLPIIVFDMNQKGNLLRIVSGNNTGTIVHN